MHRSDSYKNKELVSLFLFSPNKNNGYPFNKMLKELSNFCDDFKDK